MAAHGEIMHLMITTKLLEMKNVKVNNPNDEDTGEI